MPLSQNIAAQNPDLVTALLKEFQAFPRGEVVNDPIWKAAMDPDIFGGEGEDRAPYAGMEGVIRGPTYPIYYIIPLMLLGIIGLARRRKARAHIT